MRGQRATGSGITEGQPGSSGSASGRSRPCGLGTCSVSSSAAEEGHQRVAKGRWLQLSVPDSSLKTQMVPSKGRPVLLSCPMPTGWLQCLSARRPSVRPSGRAWIPGPSAPPWGSPSLLFPPAEVPQLIARRHHEHIHASLRLRGLGPQRPVRLSGPLSFRSSQAWGAGDVLPPSKTAGFSK